MSASPIGTLVIGYGNTLRGDDGVGPYVASALAARVPPGVRVLSLSQLTPDLALDVAAATRVVFIDASTDTHSGPVEITRLEPCPADAALTHCCDPAALLALTHILYDREPEAWLITVAGERFDLGEGLSSSARRNAEAALHKVEAILI